MRSNASDSKQHVCLVHCSKRADDQDKVNHLPVLHGNMMTMSFTS